MRSTIAAALLLGTTATARADEPPWASLDGLAAWNAPTADWFDAGDARVDPGNPRRLVGSPGSGVLVNGPVGLTRNIRTRESFGPVEMHAEFLIPKGSNAGIKFVEIYEVQIFDSFGKSKLGGDDCGGLYPRAELLPRYRHLDDGVPPRLNACKPPGEWQSFDISFQPPRFDPTGKTKLSNARFVRVALNGQVVQSDVELSKPTGHTPPSAERPTGPILLQADHGPVAFRNLRVRAIPARP